MFKQIFRITFVTLIWKQYKRAIASTLLLFAFLWLVGNVHQDYLVYAAEQNDEGLVGRSFLYKWLALVSGVLLYLSYHWLRSTSSKSVKEIQPKNGYFTKNNSSNGKANSLPDGDQGDDPFAELRNKNKLRSRAEILVDKQKP
ncbi:MAG: hypothetical protein ACI9WC_001906 [Arenicella sp.]|jgi:hypothetical protein